MAYTTVAMILVADSLGHCAIPRLSRLYTAGRLAEFRALLLKLLAAGGGLGLAGLAAAQFMGVRLLTLMYGREYAVHYRVFLVLIVATAIHCVACMFTSAITSARCFRIQVPPICAGRRIERLGLRAMGAGRRAGRRRRCHGGRGSGATRTRRHGRGLSAVGAVETCGVSSLGASRLVDDWEASL